MTATEIARLFGWKRGPMRAKCPVHKSRGLTLQIFADKESVGVYCFAGCEKKDILAAVGLTWKDTMYNDKHLTPEERREWARKKEADALMEQIQRQEDITMILSAKPIPRTKDKFEQDLEAFTGNVLC